MCLGVRGFVLNWLADRFAFTLQFFAGSKRHMEKAEQRVSLTRVYVYV